LRSLSRSFNTTGADGSRSVDAGEFFAGLADLGVDVSSQLQSAVCAGLDASNSGSINYDDFLVLLRGAPNPVRRAAVENAFQVLS